MKKYWDLVTWSYILLLQTYMNQVEFYLNQAALDVIGYEDSTCHCVSRSVPSHSLSVVYCQSDCRLPIQFCFISSISCLYSAGTTIEWCFFQVKTILNESLIVVCRIRNTCRRVPFDLMFVCKWAKVRSGSLKPSNDVDSEDDYCIGSRNVSHCKQHTIRTTFTRTIMPLNLFMLT